MAGRLLRLLAIVAIAAALLGPLIAACALIPSAALAPWPAWGLTFVPPVLRLVAALPYFLHRPLIAADLPADAGTWLRQRLVGVTVGAMGPTDGPFFHPASRTIVLPEAVQRQHTAVAYAAAAHELGHAVFVIDRPRLATALHAARARADHAYAAGVGVLFGAALAGATALYPVGFGLIAVATILFALVVVDEVMATTLALAHLRDDLDAANLRIARRHLQRALATYLATLVGYLLPLVAGGWIVTHLAGAALPVGATPTGARATAATLGAIAVGLGALGVVAGAWGLRGKRLFEPAAMALALGWAPLLVALVHVDADAPRWIVACAVVPTWGVLSLVGWVVIWLAARLLHLDDEAPLPRPDDQVRGRVTPWSLARHEQDSALDRLLANAYALWTIPLALWWLTV